VDGGLTANRYGTISTALTFIFSPRSIMIHGASLDAPMHRVSAVPSVQILMTVGLRSAVMYLCDSTTVFSARRCLASTVRPISPGLMPIFSFTSGARPPSKNMRVGGRKYIPSLPNGGSGGGGGAGGVLAAANKRSQNDVNVAHPAPKNWLHCTFWLLSNPETPACASENPSHVGAQIGRS